MGLSLLQGAAAGALIAAAAFLCPSARAEGEFRQETPLDLRAFQVVRIQSGPDNYYRLVDDPAFSYIHSAYRPRMETTVLAVAVPEPLRGKVKKLRWKWRAVVLPEGGDECRPRKTDSAAVVYVTFKRGLKWYTLKYVWSSVGRVGAVCDRQNKIISTQVTLIRESGLGSGCFVTEEIDLASEFRRHLALTDPDADVPDFVGVGIMSDGDQTKSPSEADFAGFTLIH